jgi:hypothetical protein
MSCGDSSLTNGLYSSFFITLTFNLESHDSHLPWRGSEGSSGVGTTTATYLGSRTDTVYQCS